MKSLFSANSYDVNDIMASASPIPLQRSGSGTRRLARSMRRSGGCINSKCNAALRGVQMKLGEIQVAIKFAEDRSHADMSSSCLPMSQHMQFYTLQVTMVASIFV